MKKYIQKNLLKISIVAIVLVSCNKDDVIEKETCVSFYNSTSDTVTVSSFLKNRTNSVIIYPNSESFSCLTQFPPSKYFNENYDSILISSKSFKIKFDINDRTSYNTNILINDTLWKLKVFYHNNLHTNFSLKYSARYYYYYIIEQQEQLNKQGQEIKTLQTNSNK